MDSSRAYWPAWLDSLQRQNLDGLVGWLLEAAGPLKVIAAQLLYVGQPLLPAPAAQLYALAHLLEEEDEARDFAALLKG